MERKRFKKLVEKGEIAREKRNYKTALNAFNEAMLISGKNNQWADFVEVVGHCIVIDKHFWQTTKDKGFLELTRSDVELGLRLCKIKKLPDRYLAVSQLRMGDVLLNEKKFKESVLWYRKAVSSLAKTPKNAGYGEYLTHLGKGLALANKKKEAERVILKALKLIKKDKNVRPFHRLVLKSGALAWLALAIKDKDPQRSNRLFKEAYQMCKELKARYKMPMRLKQFNMIKKEHGL